MKKINLCLMCYNFKKKMKYYEKKIEIFLNDKNEQNYENFILKNKLNNNNLNNLKFSLLKQKLKEKMKNFSDEVKSIKLLKKIFSENNEKKNLLLKNLIKIIENNQLPCESFFFTYLTDAFRNITNKRNNNNIWSDSVVNFFIVLQYYSSWKALKFLSGDNTKQSQIIINNGIKKNYSKGENSNFNFLIPSRSTISKKKKQMMYGNLLDETKINLLVNKIKEVDKTHPDQPIFLSFDSTSIRSGFIIDSSGFIFGGVDPISIKDFNQNEIFKNKSKEIMVIFLVIPLLKLSFIVSIFNIYTEKNEDLLYNKINDLLKTLNDPYFNFMGLITDDSPLSTSVFKLLKIKFKEIFHIKDPKHILKNLRNCVNDKKTIFNNDGVCFNLRELIWVIHECKINISSIHPYDKMDEGLVLDLLNNDIIDCCSKSNKLSV
jgi:hypothetical protein